MPPNPVQKDGNVAKSELGGCIDALAHFARRHSVTLAQQSSQKARPSRPGICTARIGEPLAVPFSVLNGGVWCRNWAGNTAGPLIPAT
jgi:hypothetical protein